LLYAKDIRTFFGLLAKYL